MLLIFGDWKLIYYYEYESFELFNLGNDLSEQNDLSAKEPAVANRLLKKLNAWTKEVNAPIPDVPNEKFNPHQTVLKENFEMWYSY